MPHYTDGGFTTVAALATALINKLRAAGLTPKYVNLGSVNDPADGMTATKATFEYALDPLAATQPWRIGVDGTGANLMMYAGTAAQLTDAGSTGGAISNNLAVSTTLAASQPNRYHLTVTARGLACGVYNPAANNTPGLFVVQRPVDTASGVPLQDGNAPVFAAALPATTSATALTTTVIREQDVLVPVATVSPLPVTGTPNAGQTLPDGSYWLVRPANLPTARAVYPQELDLVQFAHASAFTAEAAPQMTLYGEGVPRTYTTLSAVTTGGIRSMLLTSGGGV